MILAALVFCTFLNAPALIGDVSFIYCDAADTVSSNSVCSSGTRLFLSLKYDFMQKIKEEEMVLHKGAGESFSEMSNRGVERAEKRMQPRDGGVVI